MSGTVTLRNGDSAPESVVIATMLNIRLLLEEDPMAFYEFVMACRDRSHVTFGRSGGVMTARRLAHVGADGRADIHSIIRSIVLSAARGDGMDMALRSPLADAQPQTASAPHPT